jgi:hypothetical protein
MSSSDLTHLKVIKNTINNNVVNSSDYIQRKKMGSIQLLKHKDTVGNTLVPSYFAISLDPSLNTVNNTVFNCENFKFSKCTSTTKPTVTTNIQPFVPKLFQTKPAIKRKTNTIICCREKVQIKHKVIYKTIPKQYVCKSILPNRVLTYADGTTITGY